MTGDHHTRASAIFLEACEMAADRRNAFLDEACGDDGDLRAAVEELLRFDVADAMVDDSPVEASWSAELAVPPRIADFEIDAVLGEGGMGVVYRARQSNPQRTVALKVMRPGRATPELTRRLEYEAHVLARLHHPAIAQVYEAGAFDTGRGRQPFFAMELVDGRGLLQHADRAGLGPRERIDLLVRLCDGVHHAHQKGVIHRDLKPGNILVDASGQPKILDFGIARLTDADIRTTTMRTSMGQLLGTLPYMSPEQVAGDSEALDLRADVYALGVIAYELLAGRLPLDLDHKPIHEAARLIAEVEPHPLGEVDRSFRGDLETIVGKAMEKDKERRYQSALALGADLRRSLADEPIEARPASALYQVRKFARRNRAIVAAGGLVVLLLVAGIAVSTTLAVSETRAKRAADRAAENADVVRRFFLEVFAMAAPEREGPDVTVVAALRRAQERIETALPDRPEIRGDVHAEMATAFARLGQLDDAEHHARTALRIRSAALGADHRSTIESRLSLAGVLLARVRRPEAYDEADALLARVTPRIADEHGDDDDLIVSLLRTRALSAFQRGQLDESERFTREALARCAAHLGDDDPATIDLRQNLGVLLRRRGRHAEAAAALEAVFDARLAGQGRSHPETIKAQRELAGAYRASGATEKAEAIYRAVLPLQEERSGDLHPTTIVLLNELAFCLKAQERYEEAVAMYGDALDRARRGPSPGAFQTVILMDSRAHVLVHLGRLDEASAQYAEGLAFVRERFPGERRAIGNLLFKLGDCHLRAERPEAALPVARNGLTEMESSFPEDDGVVVNLRATVARALFGTGARDEARALLDRCLADYGSMAGRDWLCERSIEGIVALCEQAGDAARAAGFRELIASDR